MLVSLRTPLYPPLCGPFLSDSLVTVGAPALSLRCLSAAQSRPLTPTRRHSEQHCGELKLACLSQLANWECHGRSPWYSCSQTRRISVRPPTYPPRTSSAPRGKLNLPPDGPRGPTAAFRSFSRD
ncbi:hypothetical protein SKAU_G00215520 [Synaphobranchus kaupii]|uniref:Uncharacterized protein n=1 Tax=Synaphobranchus kaupii TaxID=118154 RepID=A0A9Q1ITC2_SYNKA|nr:hypothetical protein SKAU_G00215520 [Synaphobranchus kaupii]